MKFDTSVAYAPGYSDKVAGSVKTRCYAQFSAIAPAGLTADELAARLGLTVLAVRPEVCHLHKEGRIKKTGEKRQNDSGLWANEWTLDYNSNA